MNRVTVGGSANARTLYCETHEVPIMFFNSGTWHPGATGTSKPPPCPITITQQYGTGW